jgi:hypothetical protein
LRPEKGRLEITIQEARNGAIKIIVAEMDRDHAAAESAVAQVIGEAWRILTNSKTSHP